MQYDLESIRAYAVEHTIKEIKSFFNFPSYGATKRYLLNHLVEHKTESRKGINNPAYKHGGKGTRLYDIWCGMKCRCYNKKDSHYIRWGGRGIKVCNEWLSDFNAFKVWSEENGYDKGLTLDRIDNNKDYFPSNCRWCSIEEQNNNQRRNIKITYKGKTQTLKQWSKELNLNYNMLLYRYRNMKLTTEEMFMLPSGKVRRDYGL